MDFGFTTGGETVVVPKYVSDVAKVTKGDDMPNVYSKEVLDTFGSAVTKLSPDIKKISNGWDW